MQICIMLKQMSRDGQLALTRLIGRNLRLDERLAG